nr:DGQHR domain-containing protein [Bradyrhizobium sp. NBAIM16]
MKKSVAKRRSVPALKVNQWLSGWDKIPFSAKLHRSKPQPHFYIFSLPAVELRALCGISRRDASKVKDRALDLGIQRRHEPERSEEIAQFVDFGYPWSTLSESRRKSADFNDMRKPGWLPTAIVINILKPGDKRNLEAEVAPDDSVDVRSSDSVAELMMPYQEWSSSWTPKLLPPFEVIDGQHRLWAFDRNADPSFELPVVAFHGLDVSWQAYLFWTINIKPKRINPSLAFDLYPLLRAEDWLDKAEGHYVYRETRSQELTEALWSNPDSPWYDRINMLGEKKVRWVTQAAWIKSLMSTLIRPWHGRRENPGGLFGSRMQEGDEVLGWSRAQQAAFLIYWWILLREAVLKSSSDWAKKTINAQKKLRADDAESAPFYGPHSLLTTDQGVRGALHVLNDLCFLAASKLELRSWQVQANASASDAEAVSEAVATLPKQKMAAFLKSLASALAGFDWRTSSDPSVTENERRDKLVFRGSSGYKEIRIQLLEHLAKSGGEVGQLAKRLV